MTEKKTHRKGGERRHTARKGRRKEKKRGNARGREEEGQQKRGHVSTGHHLDVQELGLHKYRAKTTKGRKRHISNTNHQHEREREGEGERNKEKTHNHFFTVCGPVPAWPRFLIPANILSHPPSNLKFISSGIRLGS